MSDGSVTDGLAERLASLPRERTQTLPALHILHDLAGFLPPDGLEQVAARLHLPRSDLYAVATSYTEFRFQPPTPGTVRVCQGLSCRIAGSRELTRSLRSAGRTVEETECLFACAVAPVADVGGRTIGRADATSLPHDPPERLPGGSYALLTDPPPAPQQDGQTRRLLERVGRIDPTSLDDARAAGAYEGLQNARRMTAENAAATVEAAGLLGRGGAYFPVHRKWMSARQAASRNGQPYLVVNAEEGEPGVFKDRALMEGDPHRLVEGLCIAAHAIGASRAYCYINGRADLSAERVRQAIDAAEVAGLLGARAGPTVEIRRGAGGYVCGEETVILESIEGRRAVPRLRPPFPTERGLWGRPTVINNVETICNLPDLFRFGPEWFRETGTDDAPGTKLISLSGALSRPGMVEVPMGTSIADILRLVGGDGLDGVVAGGPSGGLLPAAKFDLPIGPGLLDPAGAALGSGGMVAFTADFPAAEVLAVQAAYNSRESCGKCTPCREGSERLADALTRLRSGGPAQRKAARRDIDELVMVMRLGSLCGLGQMAVGPATSALQDFAGEIGATEGAER